MIGRCSRCYLVARHEHWCPCAVACPVCGAPEGRDCYSGTPHLDRRVAAATRATPKEETMTASVTITLGERYRDTVTGFTGKATARLVTVEGSERICLEALKTDGTIGEEWVHALRLEAEQRGF